MKSFRWVTNKDFEVDAYWLAGHCKYYLFVYLKSGIPWTASIQERLKADFEAAASGGSVGVVSGALKLKQESKPLEPRFFGLPADAQLICTEGNGARVRLEASGVLNPGLFLDHAKNRAELARGAAGRSLLNLFCYSGAFTAAAIAGGAVKTVNVDSSKRYLSWAKQNAALTSGQSGGDLAKNSFLHDDAVAYLRKIAIRGGEKFDWIVIDPPTFSRGERGKVFRVQKDLPQLVQWALQCFSGRGGVLASSNDASWDSNDFLRELSGIPAKMGLKLSANMGGADESFPPDHPLKSIWFRSGQ